jgi:hypothetical protein
MVLDHWPNSIYVHHCLVAIGQWRTLSSSTPFFSSISNFQLSMMQLKEEHSGDDGAYSRQMTNRVYQTNVYGHSVGRARRATGKEAVEAKYFWHAHLSHHSRKLPPTPPTLAYR